MYIKPHTYTYIRQVILLIKQNQEIFIQLLSEKIEKRKANIYFWDRLEPGISFFLFFLYSR